MFVTKTRVTRSQFEIGENEVRHIPTGARFWAYPGIAEPHRCNRGRADIRFPNGEDYHLSDIQVVATQLLVERR
jgi:hypothetical protein